MLIAGAGLAIMITASVFARRTGIAAPLLLVALGIAASYLPGAPTIHVEPELVLAGVLSVVIFPLLARRLLAPEARSTLPVFDDRDSL